MVGEGQGLSRDPNMVLIHIDLNQIQGKFKRALIIDDETEYANSIRENLEMNGFEAQVSSSLEGAAQELFKRSYPLIICDNIFHKLSNRRGSEFIRDHETLLGNGQVILMTGYPENQIVDFNILQSRGVKYVRKGHGAVDRLKNLCSEIVEARARKYTDKLTQLYRTIVEKADDESELELMGPEAQLLQRAKKYLINYMKQIPNPDMPQFLIGNAPYSPKALIEEIEKGTDISRMLIDQLLDDILEAPDER